MKTEHSVAYKHKRAYAVETWQNPKEDSYKMSSHLQLETEYSHKTIKIVQMF